MKVKIKMLLLLFCSVLFWVACSDDGKDYKFFKLEDREDWKSKTSFQLTDDFIFRATEVPTLFYILKSNKDLSGKQIDSIQNSHAGERIVEFEVEAVEKDDILEEKYTGVNYQKSVSYFSFMIKNDFKVVVGKDTIPCSNVVFERSYKLAPYQKLMLYFSGISPKEEMQLIYDDHLFKQGVFKFKMKERPIKL